MSLTSNLKSPRSPVGEWARWRFANAKALYRQLAETAEPVRVRPDGWGDNTDQRWSWAGMACETMLRWQLGATRPSGPAQAGARRLLRRLDATADLADTDLGWLLTEAADPADVDTAAQRAVLWALAEQHARYAATDNPLTAVGDWPADQLLATVPADVVADVAAVAAGPGADIAASLATLGPVTAGLAFAYPGGADLDLIAGTTLVEVKTTTSRRGFVDVVQPVCYALLAEPGTVDTLTWAFPRSGKRLQLRLDDVIEQTVAEHGLNAADLRDELATWAGIVN